MRHIKQVTVRRAFCPFIVWSPDEVNALLDRVFDFTMDLVHEKGKED